MEQKTETYPAATGKSNAEATEIIERPSKLDLLKIFEPLKTSTDNISESPLNDTLPHLGECKSDVDDSRCCIVKKFEDLQMQEEGNKI